MGFLYLVGGLNPSEKYESQVSWDDYSDNIYILYIYILYIYIYYGKTKHVPNHQPESILAQP